jgi:hypothetical protein
VSQPRYQYALGLRELGQVDEDHYRGLAPRRGRAPVPRGGDEGGSLVRVQFQRIGQATHRGGMRPAAQAPLEV